jgi:hypothetical protein
VLGAACAVPENIETAPVRLMLRSDNTVIELTALGRKATTALLHLLDIAIRVVDNVLRCTRKNRLPTLGLSFGIVYISFRLFVLVSFGFFRK